MKDPTNVGTFIFTQSQEDYAKALMTMVVCLVDVEINDDKINKSTKKKIINKSTVYIYLFPKQKLFVAKTSSVIIRKLLI